MALLACFRGFVILVALASLVQPPSVCAAPPRLVLRSRFGDQGQRQRPLGTPQQSATKPTSGLVALGDSYGAGIGTGVDGDEDNCRLGHHAYPALIYADLARHGAPGAFQWRSCTGATTKDLIYAGGQIATLNNSLPADFSTLSIGGNDLGFFDVINACVFRFYSYYSGTCDAALHRAATLVASRYFEIRLEIALLELLDAVRWERHPRFTVVVTGYARFFNADTEACNNASLGFWAGGPKLQAALRAQLNSLVLAVNAKLKRTVEGVNARFAGERPKVLFVDYDAAFEGHRFCEPGVSEPDYDRSHTWFFLVGGPDNARNSSVLPNGTASSPLDGRHLGPRALAYGHPIPSASRLHDPDRCLRPAQDSGDWGSLALCYISMAKQRDPSLRPAHVVLGENPGWYIPTSYAKVFHPRSLGHEAIRDSIYREWNETFGYDMIPGVV